LISARQVVTAHLSGCVLQRKTRVTTPKRGQKIPNIQYSDLVARFLELDIAPQKNPQTFIL